MKIGFENVDKINSDFIRNDLKRIKSNEKKAGSFESEDTVELSSKALNLRNMQAEAMKTSDIRQEKVAEIKMQVENGTYKINHEEVAERLVEDHVLE